jgi:hypothetical protein
MLLTGQVTERVYLPPQGSTTLKPLGEGVLDSFDRAINWVVNQANPGPNPNYAPIGVSGNPANYAQPSPSSVRNTTSAPPRFMGGKSEELLQAERAMLAGSDNAWLWWALLAGGAYYGYKKGWFK